ncbi:hypothetical protein ALC57_12151, partial [Trachymyrmex cornetzi]
GAMRFATYLTIVFAVLNFVNALPFPQFDNDDQERLVARDYGFPLFWYRRPIYDDSDDNIIIGSQVLDGRRRSCTMSYVNVGSLCRQRQHVSPGTTALPDEVRKGTNSPGIFTIRRLSVQRNV